MDIKKLNEELEKFIVNEISDTTKMNLLRARKAQKDAADAKYNRTLDRLTGKKTPYIKPEVVDEPVETKLSNKLDTVDGYTTKEAEDLIYNAIVNVDLTELEDSVKEIEQQAEEKPLFDDGPFCLAKVIVPFIDSIPVDKLTEILNESYKVDHSLFPSNWDAERFGKYPAKLAQALVNSKENESLGDLRNCYYRLHGDSCMDEAKPVWEKDIIENPSKHLIYMDRQVATEEDTIDMLNEFLDNGHKKVVDAIVKWVERNWEDEAATLKAQLNM